MNSVPSTNVECECRTMYKPVDYLGDSVCKSPSANVREIIKKYEPDRELLNQTRSAGSVSNQRSLTRSLNRDPLEEAEAKSTQTLTPQSTPKPGAKSLEKAKCADGKRSPGTISNRTNIPNAMKRSLIPSPGNSYKSKTTITRTPQGVHIATDILFESCSNIPERWVGRRIHTDLPNSKILQDFESKSK